MAVGGYFSDDRHLPDTCSRFHPSVSLCAVRTSFFAVALRPPTLPFAGFAAVRLSAAALNFIGSAAAPCSWPEALTGDSLCQFSAAQPHTDCTAKLPIGSSSMGLAPFLTGTTHSTRFLYFHKEPADISVFPPPVLQVPFLVPTCGRLLWFCLPVSLFLSIV
ncbi:hypothetical protein B6259_02150 [Ruminococcaceae bacterium CPB6]|nr:hypothetical protein B6259_02150 [Ruminococcaceae bacterium CPB6]